MKGVSRKMLIGVLLSLSITKAEDVEPICSKFDFEEKVLEKVVKQEYEAVQRDAKIAELEQKVIAIANNQKGNTCPDRTTAFKGSCYFVGPTVIPLASAKRFCEDRIAALVQVDTAEEQFFLIDWLAQLGGPGYWMDMTDLNTQGSWTRLDNTTPVNFTAWADGEPNGGPNENCACLFKPYSYKMNDEACTSSLHPLCEYRV